jgi:hypothetical protein
LYVVETSEEEKHAKWIHRSANESKQKKERFILPFNKEEQISLKKLKKNYVYNYILPSQQNKKL